MLSAHSFDIRPSANAYDPSSVWIVILTQHRERRGQAEWRRTQVEVPDLTEFDVGILLRIGIGGRQQIANARSPELIERASDRFVGEMNHEIACKPCVDVRQRI